VGQGWLQSGVWATLSRTMVDAAGGKLVVVSDREPLMWILETERIAFPTARRWHALEDLEVGQQLFLYTTRGCFRNPTRDRGQVIAALTLASIPEPLNVPVRFGDRSFELGASLGIDGVTPARHGYELMQLRGRLDSMPTTPGGWAMHLRRSLIELSAHDTRLLAKALAPLLRPLPDVIDSYRGAVRGRSAA
jgi:hypothetical protein